jgi:cytochrome c5
MSTVRWFATAAAVLALTAGLAWSAAEPEGKTLFREYCKPCHAPNSAAGEVTPMTLIQEQWERFFKEKLVPSHKDLVDQQHGGKKVLDVITPEMLEKIKKFSIDHAADSEHPMTCG